MFHSALTFSECVQIRQKNGGFSFLYIYFFKCIQSKDHATFIVYILKTVMTTKVQFYII